MNGGVQEQRENNVRRPILDEAGYGEKLKEVDDLLGEKYYRPLRPALFEFVFDTPRELIFLACTDPELTADVYGDGRRERFIAQALAKHTEKFALLERPAVAFSYIFQTGTIGKISRPSSSVA